MKKKSQPKNRNPFYLKPSLPDETVKYPLRLNKFIAKTGLCSRRKAATLVKEGLINLNGKTVREPHLLVNEQDKVTYKGKTLQLERRLVYLLLNKPKDVITTTDDERGRKTVFDLIKEPGVERLFPVGRLDRQTMGLLLITNDGDLAKKLTHPSHEVRKEYLVLLDRSLTDEDFDRIRHGLILEDGPAPVKDLKYVNEKNKAEVMITLFIGRNRIVRRIFAHCNYQVKRLDRVYLAGLTKKNLPRGRYRHLTPREILMLKHFT